MRALAVILAVGGLAVAGSASAANLIVNGDFADAAAEAGYTTQYTYVNPTGNPNGLVPEGTYTVADNPNSVHPYWVDETYSTNLLLVNGATGGSPYVWQEQISAPVTGYYHLTADVVNLCCNSSFTGPNNSSMLTFNVTGGAYASPYAVAGYTTASSPSGPSSDSGVEEAIQGYFYAVAGTSYYLTINNGADASSGNDFGVTNIALTTPTPEPATWALMIGGLGLAGVTLRRRRIAARFA